MDNISFQKYIDIVSSVGGASETVARELILRLFSTSDPLPTNTVVEFTDAESVLAYFDNATDSAEFLQAQFYFSYVSKQSTSPNKISFARWAKTALLPKAFGAMGVASFTDFDGVSTGTLLITLGSDTEELSGIDFTSDNNLVEAATTITAAINAASFATTMWTNALCSFDATNDRFVIDGGDAVDAVIAINPAAGGIDIAPFMGMLSASTRFSAGSDIQTVTEVLTESTAVNNNFGSFAFIPTLTVTNDGEVEDAATWAHGENVKFMYLQKVLQADAAALAGFVSTYSGTGLTVYDAATEDNEFPWLIPGMIFAAIPYQRRASVPNYMFKTAAGTTAVIGSTQDSNTLDALRVNYYGQTQQAGQTISFYQRGLLQGLSDRPLDMGVFGNEVFLKDAIGVSIMNLLLALSAVPANATGIGQVLATIQSSIDLAVFNGSISIGKSLNVTQRVFITSVTGDENAYLQIQNIGYWINAVVGGNDPNFEIQYTLLYSKNDVVRKVVGAHTLI